MNRFIASAVVTGGFILCTSGAFASGRYVNDNRSYIQDRSITNNDHRNIDQSVTTINDNRTYIEDRSITNNDYRSVYESGPVFDPRR